MINTEEILVEALTAALEKMAFLTVIPMDQDLRPPKDTLLSEIHFSGPRNATIQILAGSDFTRLLAENYTAGQDTDHAACLDVFQELSNVTCGLLLPLLCGSEQDIFDMTVPRVYPSQDAPGWETFTADGRSHVLNVENNLVAIKLV